MSSNYTPIPIINRMASILNRVLASSYLVRQLLQKGHGGVPKPADPLVQRHIGGGKLGADGIHAGPYKQSLCSATKFLPLRL